MEQTRGRAATSKERMTPADVWFVGLSAACVAGPYLLGVRPQTRRQWLYVAITIAFLAWLLPLMTSVLSR
jgi:hypothetical protein